MIKILEIKNFKSIKHLKLDCKKINIFLGEPNVGKSNILESLGLLSFTCYSWQNNVHDFVRFEKATNLFHDDSLEETCEIRFDDEPLILSGKGGRFIAEWRGKEILRGNYDDLNGRTQDATLAAFKFYRFAVTQVFPRQESEFLLPPSGANLMALLQSHKDLRAATNRLFAPYGLRLGLRAHENRIEVIKHAEDIIISYPYSLTSDTLQRLVFYLSALLSNKDSVIIFEEPEAHAFPYHTKYLAETIALDERSNQFFLSTHNPYLLLPLLEKAGREDVAVFITYFEGYQTKVKLLSEKSMRELTEIDVFSNLERFLPKR